MSKIAVVVSTSGSKHPIVTQIKRGPRGTTNIKPVAPLILNTDDELAIGTFTFTQTANLATWTIEHGLNKLYPHVVVKDTSGQTVWGEYSALDRNTLTINFNFPVIGTAFFS